jgi:hypothetical protein
MEEIPSRKLPLRSYRAGPHCRLPRTSLTPDTLRQINGLYSRWVRLTKTLRKPSAAQRSEGYMIRLQLEELGLDVLKEESPPLTPCARGPTRSSWRSSPLGEASSISAPREISTPAAIRRERPWPHQT